MRTWEEVQKSNQKIEMAGIVGIAMCIIAGIGCDVWILLTEKIAISIGDIESLSLTILQIQATVGTLIIAIIALITGNISDSYLGVSVSNFYLNIKPWKLKQKVLILISLGLCLAGLIFHVLKFFNTVFFVFVATGITIVISIMEIYSSFEGKTISNYEIESYLKFIFDSDVDVKTKTDMYKNFVSDWTEEIVVQDKQSFEKRYEMFSKWTIKLWDVRTEQSREIVQQQCYSLFECLLSAEKDLYKERGIDLIQRVYDMLWWSINNDIIKNTVRLNDCPSGFFLFSEIESEIIQSIESINIESFEKIMKIGNFIDSIQRIAIWTRYDVDSQNLKSKEGKNSKKSREGYENEIDNLCYFARYFGSYLKRQKTKGNLVNQYVWANVLNGWSMFSSYNIPEDRCEDFLKAKLKIYFNYCYGMIMSGQEEIIREGLYVNGMKSAVRYENKYQALLYLSVHCYIYYLAEREQVPCVSDAIKQTAKRILSDRDVKISFSNFLDGLAENENWIDSDLYHQLCRMLERYELFPGNNIVKRMVIKPVVTDFYLFMTLFMSRQYFLPELIGKNIDDVNFFSYVKDESYTLSMLKTLFIHMFTGTKSEEKIDIEVGLMYDDFEKEVKRKQKERYKELAIKEQKIYEETIDETQICEKIKDETMKKIREKFSPIFVNEASNNKIIRIKLLEISDYTESLNNKKLDGYYADIEGCFLYGIEGLLRRFGVVDIKNRFDDFTDDRAFMEYLCANNLKILLGSRYILKNKDYRLSTEYNTFLDEYETIYTSFVNNGIGLRKGAIQIYLHDVNVSIHSPSIKESKAQYDKKTGKYYYSIVNGVPVEFEKNELREYLYNRKKVINISAKISIQVNDNLCGTIFESRSI